MEQPGEKPKNPLETMSHAELLVYAQQMLVALGDGMRQIKDMLERLPKGIAERFFSRVEKMNLTAAANLRLLPTPVLVALLLSLNVSEGFSQEQVKEGAGLRRPGQPTQLGEEYWTPAAGTGAAQDTADAPVFSPDDGWGKTYTADEVSPQDPVGRAPQQFTGKFQAFEPESFAEILTPSEFDDMKAIPGFHGFSLSLAGVRQYTGPDATIVRVVRHNDEEFYVGLQGDARALKFAIYRLRDFGTVDTIDPYGEPDVAGTQ